MKKFILSTVPFLIGSFLFAQSPQIVAECTVSFTISVSGGSQNAMNNAAKTLFIKGRQARVDIAGPSFKQSVIYDNNTGIAVILREIGGNKYISTLDSSKWKDQNKQYDGMSLTLTSETKTILGYECKKAIAKLKNGNTFSMYYATAIKPSATENPYQFKDLPGFVLEYESEKEGSTQKVTYTANKINLNPVPVATFEIPSKGYRIL